MPEEEARIPILKSAVAQTASKSPTWVLFLEGVGPVVAGVLVAILVLAVLTLMYYCCRQNNKLGQLKPSALPSKLRQQFRYDRVQWRTQGQFMGHKGLHKWYLAKVLAIVGLIQGRQVQGTCCPLPCYDCDRHY